MSTPTTPTGSLPPLDSTAPAVGVPDAGMLDRCMEAAHAAQVPAGSVSGTDVHGLLRAAEMMLDRYAEQYDRDGLPKNYRRARQLATIVDHVRRVEQSDSTGYVVEKSMMVVDAAVQLEFDARSQMAESGDVVELIDEATEQIESLIRRARPVVSGLAGGELRREDIRDLVERVEGLTRWVRQLEPIASQGGDE